MVSRESGLAARNPRVSGAMMCYYRARARSSSEDAAITALAHANLVFNAPMSDTRATELVASVQPLAHARVADLGCGWAELLLRMLAAEGTATGVGIDTDAGAIERGLAAAAARGLRDRVRLEVADIAAMTSGPADVVLCIGASYAWAGVRPALQAIRPLLRPGGRLLLGEPYWERPPGPQALAALGAVAGDLGSLADLTDLAVACGYGITAVATASTGEWDAYESGWCGGLERWLLHHPCSPRADRVRAAADRHRQGWLNGRRGTLGFAYLTLSIR